VIKGLHAGKALHVEKPLAMTSEQLDEILNTYSEAQHPFLMVGFNRRFSPMVQKARQFFVGCHEPLAMNYRINAGFVPLTHWAQDSQQGGGRIIGELCHFIDLLQFLADALVQRVYTQALPNQGKYNNDNVAITIGLTDGSVGTILYVANGDKALPKEYIEIFGGGKAAIIDDYRSLALFNGGRKTVSRQGARDKGHKDEMTAWVEAIRSGQPEPVPFDHAVAATRATFAVLKSLSEGQPISVE
jgi:polar amino acid transport system substrate-binding protein